MAYALILVPLALALIALGVQSNTWRARLLPLTGALHVGMTAVALRAPTVDGLDGWLHLDSVGRLVLGLCSVLYFFTSLYAPGYLASHPERANRVFCACFIAFIGALSLVTEAHHLGLMWVAIESTTLTSAPMINFVRSPRALEATWKYLLIGSVGIAVAFLGSLFLAYSALYANLEPSLLLDDLVRDGSRLSRPWLRAAFILLFVGYGTKMGLAPMHTWKPDAYGEAPGMVGALLAGGLTSCAFLAILRFFRVCNAAGDASFVQGLLLIAGLFSMAVAAAFMARQKDFKRMLAYSSVEHMGILVVGLGVGGAGVFGSLLHMLNNGLTKGVLFLSAANIHRAYGSKSSDDVRGVLRRLPASGALLLAGFFAITGSPPFGPFLSEFTILNAAVMGGQYGVVALFLVMLLVIFIGMGATVMVVVQGKPSEGAGATQIRDTLSTVGPSAALLALVLMLGVYVPPPLDRLLRDAAASLGAER
ncbi:MAG TPA: proton-conducting transporter membrane subunit [Polyangiaceae bacterium]|nr:proton-conducting transporter membrane subunit [Polyangiaceae bacterium]